MRLISARIRNFRSIAEQEISFEPRCRILVGVNESGKSNVLRALALLDPNSTWSPEDIREFNADEAKDQEATVYFTFGLDDDERQELRDEFIARSPGASIGRKLVAKGDKALTVTQTFDRITNAYYEVNLLEDSRDYLADELGPEDRLVENWHKPSPSWPKGEAITLKDGSTWAKSAVSFVHDVVAPQLPAGYLVPATIEDFDQYILDAVVDIAEAACPGCLYWTYSDANLLPANLDLDTFATNPASCVPLHQMFKLAGYVDIKAVVATAKTKPQGVRNLLARVATVATKHVRKVWADYRDLEIELAPSGGGIDAHILDKYNRYGFARRSDGFKRFISFLLLVSSQDALGELTNTLFIQDEPDTGLHPSGTRHLRDELIRIAKKNYVAVSTHSIFMIDRDEIGRHLIVRKDDEKTALTEATESNIKDEEVIYNALGFSMFEALDKRNIIFEGWRDKQLFRKVSEKLAKTSKKLGKALAERGLCHANGVGDIERVTSVLELARRQWIVVSDADEAARREQARYEGDGKWFRYDELDPSCEAVTGEDFIVEETFAEALLELAGRDPRLAAARPLMAPTNGRVERLRKWMSVNGLDARESKALLDWLKSRLFSDLSPAHVIPSYTVLVEQIVAKS